MKFGTKTTVLGENLKSGEAAWPNASSQQGCRMIGAVIGALGAKLGRRVGLAYGRRRADEVAWEVANALATSPPAHGHAVHADGTVEW